MSVTGWQLPIYGEVMGESVCVMDFGHYSRVPSRQCSSAQPWPKFGHNIKTNIEGLVP